ncbi:MAG: hypothetical protein JNK80_09625 [Dechloromonas sp.]|nr:hypothetical protein [Dechloromonas sp.]
MEQEFRDWLLQRGNAGAAGSYPRAIHTISEHYSRETQSDTDIYAITDQALVSQIAHDYSQAGRFSAFGYEQHGRFRNAIARYSEFFVRHRFAEEVSPPESPLAEPAEQVFPPAGNFAYEKDLQTALCAQITELFPNYRIFGNGIIGIEYAVGGRRIDVLLESADGSELLVVELKSGVADYKVFGQISMYIGILMQQFKDKKILGAIVAGGIDESLKQACATTDRISLKVYRMSIELEDA